MIYTLTINPAIDLNLQSAPLLPSVVNRTYDAVYSPNGKGINVSRIIRHFGGNSIAMGFFGGFTGKYIVETLRDESLKVMPVWVEDRTRINIFLNDTLSEYKLVNEGASVEKEQQEEMLQLVKLIKPGGILVISGSLAQGMQEDFYDELLNLAKAKDLQVVLDISSQKLKNLLRYKPLLIKPNDDELRDIWGIVVHSRKDCVTALKQLHHDGAQNILLTMGDQGMYFYNGSDCYYCNAPQVKLVSSACAGDGALGTFLYQWVTGNPLEKALKMASAVGADIAGSAGLGELKRYNSYLRKITVEQMDV